MGQLCDSSNVSSIISLMSLILDLLFPKLCVGCKKIGTYLCPSCEKKIEFIAIQNCPVCSHKSVTGETHKFCKNKFTLDGSTAITRYKYPIRQAVHQIKYRLVKDEIKTFGDLMVSHLPNNFPNFDIIIPIPLHPNKLKDRGFNQAEELAKIISLKLNIPITTKVLLRTKFTQPQFNLKEEERKKNIKGAFVCKSQELIKDKRILLIDDLATTFSTVNEAANVLKRSGPPFIWSLVLAHGK